jgi:GTP-binding protein Era
LLDDLRTLPAQQPWWYDADELTDRSEKFLASETGAREAVSPDGRRAALHLHRGDRASSRKRKAARNGHKRLLRIAATIVVERDGHKAMVIGDKGERIKRIGTEARVELESLLDAKVFLEAVGQGALGLGR